MSEAAESFLSEQASKLPTDEVLGDPEKRSLVDQVREASSLAGMGYVEGLTQEAFSGVSSSWLERARANAYGVQIRDLQFQLPLIKDPEVKKNGELLIEKYRHDLEASITKASAGLSHDTTASTQGGNDIIASTGQYL